MMMPCLDGIMIFREKSGDFNPDSSVGPKVSRQRAKYDDALPGRDYDLSGKELWILSRFLGWSQGISTTSEIWWCLAWTVLW
jgi:hypothetical protein